jgi:hypothetical protein
MVRSSQRAARGVVLAAGSVVALIVVFAGAALAMTFAIVTLRPLRAAVYRGRAVLAGLLLVGASGVAVSSVAAQFSGTPNSSIATAAGPVGSGVTYSGRFETSGETDYYYFTTTRDNVRLHFTVRNTVQSCASGGNCHIYATLIDPAGKQLGGEGSTAGTGPVGYAGSGYDTDTIDWTFPTAGRYLLAFDSEGDLPSYEFRIDPADGIAAATSPTLKGPLFTALSVPSPQRGPRVRVSFTNLQAGATATVKLLRTVNGRRVAAGRMTRGGLAAGAVTLRVALNAGARAALKRRAGLRLTVRTTVSATGRNTQTSTRGVTVRPAR